MSEAKTKMICDSRQLKELSVLCRYAGERFDLAQAGGGNASVKTEDGLLVVKASGVALIDVGAPNTLSSLKMAPLIELLEELSQDSDTTREALESKAFINERMEKARVDVAEACGRPSIETLLHAAMPNCFTLHTHPISVCSAAFRSNWRQTFSSIFPEALLIPYATPGTPLSLSLYKALSKDKYSFSQPDHYVAFLQNHGLIVTAETQQEAQRLTDEVCLKLESAMGFDLSCYRNACSISVLFRKAGAPESTVAWVVQNRKLYDAMHLKDAVLDTLPCCPDFIVYCGVSIVSLDSLDDAPSIKSYVEVNGEYPKVVTYDGQLYTVGSSIKKCREAEDLLAFHTESLSIADGGNISALNDDEQQFLMHWEAEHYRRKI